METISLEQAFSKLLEQGQFMLDKSVKMLPNFLFATLVIVLFFILSRRFSKSGGKVLKKLSQNATLSELFVRLIRLTVLIIGLFIALGIMHLDKTVTSLLAGVGIVGLALSFAFQHTAANLLSGVIISLRKSINVGDMIESNGHMGNVVNVGIRSTFIINAHGQHVEIPNRLILDNPMRDYSASGFRRIDIHGQLNLKEDLVKLKKAIESNLSELDFIYPEKQPSLIFTDTEFEKAKFNLRVWMNFTNNDGEFMNARSKCIEKLSEVLRAENVEQQMAEVINYRREG